jgi:hypothetical protein
MRDDFDGYEIVDVQEDTSKWWQGWYIDWRLVLLTAVIGLPGLLLKLSQAQS